MHFLRLCIIGMALFSASLAVSAQPEVHRPSPLDERGGMPIPENLLDLKNLSLAFWLKFRQTNQTVYNYVNEAALFHSYLYVCKRHDLNVQMDLVTKLANKYLQAAIPAHYDEPEFEILEAFSKEEQQLFLDDMSSDIYSFEYGMRVAEQLQKAKESGKTVKQYCEGIQKDYFQAYVALLATAKRRLAEIS